MWGRFGCVGIVNATFIADAGSVGATPIPSDRELLIQRLMGTVHPVQPVLQERSNLTDIEIILQSLLPVGTSEEENVSLVADRQEPTAVCFLCGELDHAASRCPVLDDSFPFLQADRTGGGFILRPPLQGAVCHQVGNVD